MKRWVFVFRGTNLPRNRHPRICHLRICSKHFVNTEGRRLYLDEILPLFLARPFISSSNKRKKPTRYQSVSLIDEPVTVVITTVHSIAPRVNRIVTTGSSPRFAKSISSRLSSIVSQPRLSLGKVNDRTSSGYKRLPSALTKCPPVFHLRFLTLSLQAHQLPMDS